MKSGTHQGSWKYSFLRLISDNYTTFASSHRLMRANDLLEDKCNSAIAHRKEKRATKQFLLISCVLSVVQIDIKMKRKQPKSNSISNNNKCIRSNAIFLERERNERERGHASKLFLSFFMREKTLSLQPMQKSKQRNHRLGLAPPIPMIPKPKSLQLELHPRRTKQ